MNLTNKRIVVTGDGGFLGSHLIEKLHHQGCQQVCAPRKAEYDLTKMGYRRRRNRSKSRQPRKFLLRERHHGNSAHGCRPPIFDGEISHPRNYLCVPEVYACPVGRYETQRTASPLPGCEPGRTRVRVPRDDTV